MTSIVKTIHAQEAPALLQHADDFQAARADLDFFAQGRFALEQIGRHVVANHADRAPALRFVCGEEPPLSDGEAAGRQILIGRANDLDAAGTAVLIPDRLIHADGRRHGRGQGHLLFDLAGLARG